MCLAIPAVVRERDDFGMGDIDIMGVSRKISLDLVPDAKPGDFVLVHAGFAIEIVDEQFANESLELIKTLPYLTEDLGLPEEQVQAFSFDNVASKETDTTPTADTAAS